MAGAAGIWWATPYVNYVMRATDLTEGYIPQGALIGVLALVGIVNPLLGAVNEKWRLSSRQMALAVGVMLIACTTAGHGLMRWLPFVLAKIPANVSGNVTLAEAYAQMNLPAYLFPAPLGAGTSSSVVDYFLVELPVGESIPWGAWFRPLWGWGSFLIGCWMLMIGTAAIVLPQWRRNERLAFPLLEVYQPLLESPGPGRILPPLFRSRLFVGSTALIFLLFILQGFENYHPGHVPRIPLGWNMRRLFTEGFLRSLPGFLVEGRLLFIVIGATFFMPTRASFSIWFFIVAYGFYEAIAKNFFPPYHSDSVADHRMGAMLAMTAIILWLGRTHWLRVLRCSFSRARSEDDRRDRTAGLTFLLGCAIVTAWFAVVVHVPVFWAVFFTGFGFMISLLIARVVCETGLPFAGMDCAYRISLVKLAPASWLGPNTLYFAVVSSIVFAVSSGISPAAMATQAVVLDKKAGPTYRSRLSLLFIGCLVVGLVVGGMAALNASYHHSVTLDGVEQPVSSWGTTVFDNGDRDILAWARGIVDRPLYHQKTHIVFGAALTVALERLSLTMPRWPLHPIGMLMVKTWWAERAWTSICIGWLLKILLLRYGGARLYRAAAPVFLGMIMGTVLASIFWTLHAVAMVLLDKPYVTGIMDAY